MWGWDHMGGYGWGMGFGWIFMLLFWVILIVAAVVAIKAVAGRSEPGGKGGDRALEILRERFARGDIGREEYEEKRRTLEGD